MIITENINSPLSIDDTNLDWSIDWGFKSVEGAGRIEISVDFWNLVSKVEMSLGYQIDVDKIVLARWLSIIESIKEKSNNIKKNGSGQNRKK